MEFKSDWYSAQWDWSHEPSWAVLPKTQGYVQALQHEANLTFSLFSTLISTPRTKNATGNSKPATEAWLICTKEEAKPYKKYKVLFGERKFARDFVSITISPSYNTIF